MAEVTISPGAEGAAASVRVGDVLTVELSENATTGYVWMIDALPEQLAELPPGPAVDAGAGPAADGPPPGAAGRRILRFAALQPGTGELRLRQARPWQPAGGDELVIAVQVEPGG